MIKTLFLLALSLTLMLSGYGQKIYQADSATEAQVKVYPVDEPDEADLWVCFVWNENEITRTGLWMDMRYAHEADVVIYFVDEEHEADLKIWLVDTVNESKWINNKKKSLLANKIKPK